MAREGVIETHASAEYLVYFLGFSPGFPYLGGMPESIAAPRLERPRTSVPAGSVAIGGKQTGMAALVTISLTSRRPPGAGARATGSSKYGTAKERVKARRGAETP